MENAIEFLKSMLPDSTTGIGFQLLIAFLAGGYLTTALSERWQRRRDTKSLLLSNTAQLVRVYQRYTRLMRQKEDQRSVQELDFLHADFLAEIKILQFDQRFNKEAEELRVITQKLANIRAGQSPEGTEKSKLNNIGQDFTMLLEKILAKI